MILRTKRFVKEGLGSIIGHRWVTGKCCILEEAHLPSAMLKLLWDTPYATLRPLKGLLTAAKIEHSI